MTRSFGYWCALACLAALPGGLFCAQTQDWASQSRVAKKFIAAGHPEKAIPIYERLVRALPGDAGLRMDLGIALDLAGQDRRAVPEFLTALKLRPGDSNVLLFLGIAYSNLNLPRKATGPLSEAVAAQPQNKIARKKLAEAYLALGNCARAAAQLRKFCELDASDPKTWYELGHCYQALSDAAVRRLLRVASDSGYCLAMIASTRAAEHQYGAALELYQQAVARMPALPGLHAELAAAYEKTGRPALAAKEEAKEKQLGAPDCARWKLACDFESRRYDEVIASQSTDTAALCYWQSKTYDREAAAAFARLEQLPPSPEAHELRSEIDVARGEFRESVADLQRAVALSPLDPAIQEHLAIAYRRIGDQTDAAALLQKLQRSQPDSAAINYLLGDTLLSSHQPSRAIPLLERAVRLSPALIAAQKSLGQAYLETGRAEEAIPHLQAALPADRDGSLYYELARAYQAAGEAKLAAAMIKAFHDRQHQIAQRESGPREAPITSR